MAIKRRCCGKGFIHKCASPLPCTFVFVYWAFFHVNRVLAFSSAQGGLCTRHNASWSPCRTTLCADFGRGWRPLQKMRVEHVGRTRLGSGMPDGKLRQARRGLGQPQAREEGEDVDKAVDETSSQEQFKVERKELPSQREGEEQERKSILARVGIATRTTFNAFMGAATLASIILAAQTIWELQGTPLTLTNAVPTLTKLLPLTGIGVFGAAQLVGLVARVVRVIITLPIMISGTWVILQNAPQLLPKGADLSGPGSVLAVLATPEVLEAAAVLAFIGGMVLWALNFIKVTFGAVVGNISGENEE